MEDSQPTKEHRVQEGQTIRHRKNEDVSFHNGHKCLWILQRPEMMQIELQRPTSRNDADRTPKTNVKSE